MIDNTRASSFMPLTAGEHASSLSLGMWSSYTVLSDTGQTCEGGLGLRRGMSVPNTCGDQRQKLIGCSSFEKEQLSHGGTR